MWVTVIWLDLLKKALTDGLSWGHELTFWSPLAMVGIPCSALIQGGGGLVLPQLGKPDFVDFPREALPTAKSGWWVGCGEVSGWRRGKGN